jgi:hypothetical protein
LFFNQRLESELKIISILSQYGGKFSNYETIFYDLKILHSNEDGDDVNLPVNLFYPHDFISFQNIKFQNENLVSIKIYLRCLLFLFKLNLPNLFISINDIEMMKANLASNLKNLLAFIRNEVIDSLEKRFYYDNIENIFDFLSEL